MRSVLLLFLTCLLLSAEKSVQVFVCLCDNEHQGIAPVGARIGNGMDPANNLYWGCSDGMQSYFKHSKKWKLLKTEEPKDSPILVKLTFQHTIHKSKLTALAYRGDRMEKCLEDYFKACRDGDKDDLIAFIGHNGLMDTSPQIPEAAKENDDASQTIVLGCVTGSHFKAPLTKMNSQPLLTTKSLMYPGSFILHDALEIWLKKGGRKEIYEAASKAYAKNQKISLKAARTIFTKP
ncbi:MAG: hypothetical protein ACN4GG_00845 [Akkermansiaceae bacterium]